MANSVVLVTGCSSGIGEALCQSFHRRGYRVVATARRMESLKALAAQGMLTLPLDVTDSEAIRRAIATILEREGRIDLLVNNAGYGQFGPLMDLSPTALHQQFATNVFAPLELVQQVAPVMKAQGKGVIVNIGSVSGVVTTPFAGAYCASKAAFHALSDALRMELQPFGIHVVTVQPGAILSHFGQAAERALPVASPEGSWYAPMQQQIVDRAVLSQQGGMPAPQFADQLVKQVIQKHPPAKLRLGPKSAWLPLVNRVLPARVFERLLCRKFGLSPATLEASHNGPESRKSKL